MLFCCIITVFERVQRIPTELSLPVYNNIEDSVESSKNTHTVGPLVRNGTVMNYGRRLICYASRRRRQE